MHLLLFSPVLPFCVFLTIVLLLSVVVLLIFRFIKTSIISHLFIVAVLILLAFCSFWSIRSYTSPSSGAKAFYNTDYHVMEHYGFEYKAPLILVNGKDPSTAIWDDKSGHIELKHTESNGATTVSMQDFFEPFYLKGKDADWLLQNSLFPVNINDGFELWKNQNRIFRLEIITKSDKKAEYRVYYGTEAKTSSFTTRLREGYAVLDIIKRTNLPNSILRELTVLKGCLLIRPSIFSNKNITDHLSELHFFPNASFLEASEFKLKDLSGNPIEKDTKILGITFSLANNIPFYIGMGKNKNKKFTILPGKGGDKILKYNFPKRYKLKSEVPDKSLVSMFFTSSNEEVTQSKYKSGFHYSIFKEKDNINHFKSTLHYYKGNARTALDIKIIGKDKSLGEQSKTYASNTIFSSATQNNKNVKWLFQLNDLRASNSLKTVYLYYFVLVYLVFVFISCQLVGLERMTTIEFLIYLIVFALLLIRIILQWRMGTFPPLAQVGPLTFNNLRSLKHFSTTSIFVSLFFFIRWLYTERAQDFFNPVYNLWLDLTDRIVIENRISKIRGADQAQDFFLRGKGMEDIFPFIIVWLCYLALGGITLYIADQVPYFSSKRFFNIALPISLYFYFEFKIKNALDEENQLPFRCTNNLLTWAILALFDAGFSIIFILFLILSNAFIYMVKVFEIEDSKSKHLFFTISGFISIILIILYTAPLFTHVYDFFSLNLLGGYIVIGTLTGIVLAVVLYSWSKIHEIIYDKKLYIWLPITIAVLISSLFFVKPNFIKNELSSFSHIKYRAKIHNTNLDDIIKEVKFDSRESRQALEAGQNQWFINNYLSKDKLWKKKQSYFNLQPHFNRGASYNAQTTDLVVTRYLIAEHSEYLVVCILGLLLLLMTGYTLAYNIHKDALSVLFKIPVLLFTIAYFIWLTATNRFLFFGQDFPLISLTSVFTVIFTLGLLLSLIILTDRYAVGNELEGTVFRKYIYPFIPIIAIFLIGFFLNSKDSIISDRKFNINKMMSEVKEDFNHLNNEFHDIQMEWADKKDNSLKTVLAQLNKETENGESIFGKSDMDDTFSKSIYDHFNSSPNKRNLSAPVYLVKEKNGLYKFGVNRSYYLVQPPSYRLKKWEGDLLAAATKKDLVFHEGNQQIKKIPDHLDTYFRLKKGRNLPFNNIHLSVLPTSWLGKKSQLPKLVFSVEGEVNNGSKIVIQNAHLGKQEIHQNEKSAAIAILPGDELKITWQHKNKQQERFYSLEDNGKNYLMKNIWLNGNRKMYYPFEGDFLWPYHYSRSIASHYKKDQLTKEKDVEVSIDYKLTKKTIALFKDYIENDTQKQVALTVIDGNGRIRVIADYKPGININPNDNEALSKFQRNNQLVINQRGERNYLGNLNLMRMKIGPGSSIKPIVYAAVTSQYALQWANLKQIAMPQFGNRYTNPKTSRLMYYAGQPIKGKRAKRNFRDLADDSEKFGWLIESYQYMACDNHQYLINSTNIYHSIIVFLGSYNRSEIKNLKSKIALGHPEESPVLIRQQQGSKNFPVFTFHNSLGNFAFNPNHFPPSVIDRDDATFFGNEKSLLGTGLKNNFRLSTYSEDKVKSSLSQDIDPQHHSIFTHTPSPYHSYPEVSLFYQKNRKSTLEDGHINGIMQSTLGAAPIKVTPIKMVEMMAQLMTFNNEFHLSLDNTKRKENNTFIKDDSWNGKYFSFVQQQIYVPLEEVIKNGTAKKLNRYIEKRKINYARIGKPMFYYAKTGTINSEDIKDRKSDKMIMVTISNKDLSRISEQQMRNVKTYSFYLTGYEFGQHNWELVKEIMTSIEDSDLFKQYFDL